MQLVENHRSPTHVLLVTQPRPIIARLTALITDGLPLPLPPSYRRQQIGGCRVKSAVRGVCFGGGDDLGPYESGYTGLKSGYKGPMLGYT